MANAEIGIYKTFTEYFAIGINSYQMNLMKSNDRYGLALKIKHNLNGKKITRCTIRPLADGRQFYLPDSCDLEIIAGEISNDFQKTGLRAKINRRPYKNFFKNPKRC